MGMNAGSGPGYSTRGSSGQNVGLYGNQPFARPTGRGQGKQGQTAAANGQGARSDGDQSASERMLELPESMRTHARDVPLRYRKQTEAYLRRLSEQTEE